MALDTLKKPETARRVLDGIKNHIKKPRIVVIKPMAGFLFAFVSFFTFYLPCYRRERPGYSIFLGFQPLSFLAQFLFGDEFFQLIHFLFCLITPC